MTETKSSPRITAVNAYITVRQLGAGHESKLTSYFASTGSLIDKDGVKHVGSTAIESYFKANPGVVFASTSPVVEDSHGVHIEKFVVRYFMMNWPFSAYFTFAEDSNLFATVTISTTT